jgi:hypothetical protein
LLSQISMGQPWSFRLADDLSPTSPVRSGRFQATGKTITALRSNWITWLAATIGAFLLFLAVAIGVDAESTTPERVFGGGVMGLAGVALFGGIWSLRSGRFSKAVSYAGIVVGVIATVSWFWMVIPPILALVMLWFGVIRGGLAEEANSVRTSDADETESDREPRAIDAVLRAVGAGAVAGTAAGFLWGGIGGRLAMRLLFLTSDDRVRGLTSDDGFEIGRFSADSIFLLVSMSVLGAIGGAAFGVLRRFLRGQLWLVAPAVALAVAAAGGGAIVEAEGIDFRVLEPLWLAIGLFVFLPGAWGATVAITTDHFMQSGSRPFNLQRLGQSPNRGASVAAWGIVGSIFVLGIIELVNDVAQLT